MKPAIRILYAEDNPQDADLTRSHFHNCAPEFEVEVADTAQACLERLRAARFDLLLLDYRLPDMNGLAVLRAVIHTGLQIPVVLVTGSGDEDLVVKALRLGAADYIPKLGNYLETMPDILRGAIKEHHRKQHQGLLVTRPVRILYVEHLPMDIEMTVQYFAEAAPNFQVNVACTGAEALLRLEQADAYDLALIDLRLPGLSGLDMVRESMRLGLALPPFIVISGQGDDAAVIAALQLGAVNYIAKREGYLNQLVYTIDQAVAHERLNRANQQLQHELAERQAIEAALRENEAQLHLALEELRRRGETIMQQATHDELTGLPNRRLFYDRLAMAISESRRYDRKVAIVFVDLDHFKEINDTLGHQAGDKFLVAIAEQIKTVPREIDTCARLGGDEFALILSNVESKEQVDFVTLRILGALDREFIIDGASLHASASIGIAIFPDDAEDAAILLKRADMAMYRSKEEGRNTYHFWDKTMDTARPANRAAYTTKAKS